METFIWKPSTIYSWKKGIAFLAPDQGTREPPVITTPDGKSYTGRYVNTNEGRHQWVFPPELANQQDLKVSYGGSSGTIANGATSYEGSSIGGWQARDKGSLGSAGGAGGVGGGYDPTAVGAGFGFAPANLEGLFPSPTFAEFEPIKAAKYKYTNPFDFASKFGELSRNEIRRNFNLSQELGIQAFNLELEGLKGFVPAAAALQRQEVALDNTFNQAERTRQIQGTLPEVPGQLQAQGQRAETLAQGRLPSSIEDRAFEVASRSRAADVAGAGGFGAQSSVARKTSDLLSAEDRLRVSQYGDQLLTQNIGTKANLLLAPTEYANAGSQIRVMPTTDLGTRTMQAFQDVNQRTLLSPESAFQGEINQQQFKTNIEQRTNEFNATGNFNASQFNATAANNFALTKFGYQVGYAGAVAGAAQTDINTQVAIAQQEAANQAFQDAKGETQSSNTIGSIANLATTIAGIIASIGGFLGDGTDTTDTVDTGEADISTEVPIADIPEDVINTPGASGGEGWNDESAPPDASALSAPLTLSASSSGADTLSFTRSAGIPAPDGVNINNFLQTVSGPVAPTVTPSTARAMVRTSNGVLQAGGVSSIPQNGYVQAGYSDNGQPVYVNRALANNQSTLPGEQDITTASKVLEPFTEFTAEDQRNMNRLLQMVDPNFIKVLDRLAASKDPVAFSRMLHKAVQTLTV